MCAFCHVINIRRPAEQRQRDMQSCTEVIFARPCQVNGQVGFYEEKKCNSDATAIELNLTAIVDISLITGIGRNLETPSTDRITAL